METKHQNYLPNVFENYMIDQMNRELLKKKILEKLTPKQITVIEKKFGFDGEILSMQEIAEQLEISKSQVRFLLITGLHWIRSILLQDQNRMMDDQIGMTLIDFDQMAEFVVTKIMKQSTHHVVQTAMFQHNKWPMIGWLRNFIWNNLTLDEKVLLFLDNKTYRSFSNIKYVPIYPEQEIALRTIYEKCEIALIDDFIKHKQHYKRLGE